MTGQEGKKLRVGGVDYTIYETDDNKIDMIVAGIRTALEEGTVAVVPVLDDERNRKYLYLNGRQVDSLEIDLGEGPPKPGELSP